VRLNITRLRSRGQRFRNGGGVVDIFGHDGASRQVINQDNKPEGAQPRSLRHAPR